MSNPCLTAVVSELEAANVPFKVTQTRKHIHIHYGDDGEHLHVVASTPSDHRAHLNERAQIRRELVSFGYIEKQDAPPEQSVIVSLTDGNATVSSLDLAEHFTKAHKDVLRSIDKAREECGVEFDQRNFAPIEYLDTKGRKYRAFRLTRDGFSLIAMGFTGAAAMAWKVKYIEAFNAMEREIISLSPKAELKHLREDVDALVGLIGEIEATRATPVRKPMFIRPSIIRRQKRLMRS